MKLKDFLKNKNMSIAEFALSMGLTYDAVRKYVAGIRVPTPRVMQEIITATNGLVMPNDFYTADDRDDNADGDRV